MTREERQALVSFCNAAHTLGDAARNLRRVLQAVEPVVPPPVAEVPPPPLDTSSVRTLLTGMFTSNELRRFACRYTPTASGRVTWHGSSLSVVFSFVTALARAGLLNTAFFDALERERPRRINEIRKVRDGHLPREAERRALNAQHQKKPGAWVVDSVREVPPCPKS